jgi:hypothetical protein
MQVTLLSHDDLIWPLGTQDSAPQFSYGAGKYPRTIKVDPYPAYSHSLPLVESLVAQCEEAFPLPQASTGMWLLPLDFIDRLNGISFEDQIYYRGDGTEWEDKIACYCGCGEMLKFGGQALTIALAGKRIPIHPAMTRYLVPHEYGHAVFHYVARKLGYKEHEHAKLQEKYMALRGIGTYAKKYSGGKWHSSPGEIIANDFRVLFTKQEIEFWPHDCALPNWGEPEGKWWKEAAEACGAKIK